MLIIYRCLTFLLFPVLVCLIYLRSIYKKEDRLRFKEKIFSSSFKSNRDESKKLIWFHVASIGELLSILPLVEEINSVNKNINFLITSVTVSSAKLLERKEKKYKNITHRFFPLDTESLSEKFLKAWKPNLVCFVDSEIWPNFLFKIKEKKIPLILINGRITKKTFNRWNLFSNFAKKVFNNFDLCLAASKESKNNLDKLCVKNSSYIGNLKFSVNNKIESLNKSDEKVLNRCKVWCAASIHPEEEQIILNTHVELKKKYKNILSIIIPRHINRTSNIKDLSIKLNLNSQILNNDDVINADAEIIIINSFGVLSKYFDYCKNVFIGKSFIKKLKLVGGQNPIEAAKLGCNILHGPYVYNFQEIYELLNSYSISEQVNTENELSDKIIKNFENPKKINKDRVDLLNIYGKKTLNLTSAQLNKFLK